MNLKGIYIFGKKGMHQNAFMHHNSIQMQINNKQLKTSQETRKMFRFYRIRFYNLLQFKRNILHLMKGMCMHKTTLKTLVKIGTDFVTHTHTVAHKNE